MKKQSKLNLISIGTYFFFLAFVTPFEIAAQNFISNPGFETFSVCPTAEGQLTNATGWVNPTAASPDYFNTCATGSIGVPVNNFGFQQPKTGNGYAGFFTFHGSLPGYREYVQSQLSSTLISQKSYCLTFYVSLSDQSQYGTYVPGVYFSSNAITGTDSTNFPFIIPQLEKPGTFVTDSIWRKINFTYIANGSEKYITIGNFDKDSQTPLLPGYGSQNYSYYYIDDLILTDNFTVTITSSTLISCPGDPVTLTASTTATNPTYVWNTGGTTSSIVVNPTTSTLYDVEVGDGICTNSQTKLVKVSNTNGVVDSVKHITSCYLNDGAIAINVFGAYGPYTYLWMPGGATTQNISGLTADSYSVTITDQVGCTDTLIQNIYVKPPVTPFPICLITVDTVTSAKNIIIWEKPVATNIDSFRIYREFSSVFMVQIGSVPYSSLSVFTDSTLGVDPKIAPTAYRISAIDSAGVESMLSNTHQTMWLQVSQWNPPGIDLSWTNYCGFPVDKYYIERDSANNGTWVTIDTVDWGTNVYTDSFPVSDSADYRIEAFSAQPCSASIKYFDPMSTTVKSSKSNSDNKISTPGSVSEYSLDEWLSVHPNPSQGKFRISSSSSHISGIEVYNLYGEKIFSKAGGGKHETISLNEVSGIYFLMVIGDNSTIVKKIIINH